MMFLTLWFQYKKLNLKNQTNKNNKQISNPKKQEIILFSHIDNFLKVD
jgi:hypothetical protein